MPRKPELEACTNEPVGSGEIRRILRLSIIVMRRKKGNIRFTLCFSQRPFRMVLRAAIR